MASASSRRGRNCGSREEATTGEGRALAPPTAGSPAPSGEHGLVFEDEEAQGFTERRHEGRTPGGCEGGSALAEVCRLQRGRLYPGLGAPLERVPAVRPSRSLAGAPPPGDGARSGQLRGA